METKRRKGRVPGAAAGDRGQRVAGGVGTSAEAPAGETAADGPPLEQALARLEAIVRELEAGNIDLDRSLALFEEGVALSRQAAKRLTEAEAKITKLVRSLDGELRTEPFAVEGEDEEA